MILTAETLLESEGHELIRQGWTLTKREGSMLHFRWVVDKSGWPEPMRSMLDTHTSARPRRLWDT